MAFSRTMDALSLQDVFHGCYGKSGWDHSKDRVSSIQNSSFIVRAINVLMCGLCVVCCVYCVLGTMYSTCVLSFESDKCIQIHAVQRECKTELIELQQAGKIQIKLPNISILLLLCVGCKSNVIQLEWRVAEGTIWQWMKVRKEGYWIIS